MKLLLDNKQALTAIYRNTPDFKIAAWVVVPYILFKQLLKETAELFKEEYQKYLNEKLKTKQINSYNDVVKQYNEIVDLLKNDVNFQKLFDDKFLVNLKNLKKINSLDFQKVTYEVDKNEDFDKIVRTLKNQKSGAILKGLSVDKDKRLITVYSSTYGIWNINNNIYIKNIEALSRSQGKIRAIYTLRKLTDLTQLQDLSRINFAIYEDLKALFDNNAIEYFAKKTQDIEGNWKTDDIKYFVTKSHFKTELNNEDLAKAAAKKDIKAETTHINKGQATQAEMHETIKENEKEIHTTYNINISEAKVEEIEKQKSEILKNYEEKILNDLIQKHQKELEELKLKIQEAKEKKTEAKKLYLNSLKNGNTLLEAVDNLKANKFNDVVVNEALEDVKADILLSVKKDEIINETKQKLEKTEKELEVTTKKYEEAEAARKTNYNNYLKELNKRKEAEQRIIQLVNVAEKLKNTIIAKNAEINDLRANIDELNKNVETLETENDKLYEQNEALQQQLKAKENEVATLNNKLKEIEKVVKTLKNEVKEKDSTINSLNNKVTEFENELKQEYKINATLSKKLEEEQETNAILQHQRDDLTQEIRELKAKVEEKESENTQLVKANTTLNSNYKELETKFSSILSENKELKAIVTKLKNENEKLKNEVAEILELRKEVQKLKEENEFLAKEKEELTQNIKDLADSKGTEVIEEVNKMEEKIAEIEAPDIDEILNNTGKLIENLKDEKKDNEDDEVEENG